MNKPSPGSFPGWWELLAAGPSSPGNVCAWTLAQPDGCSALPLVSKGLPAGKPVGQTPEWATATALCCSRGSWLMDVMLHDSGEHIVFPEMSLGGEKMLKYYTVSSAQCGSHAFYCHKHGP